MINRQSYRKPIMYAPLGSLRGNLTNQPGDVIMYTPVGKQHIAMIYGFGPPYDWDDAMYGALLEITGDSDD